MHSPFAKPTNRFFLRKITFIILLFGQPAIAQNDTLTVSIAAITGLQYDKLRFAILPNQLVKIKFKNDDDMAHNLVFVQPGARLSVVEAALKLGDKSTDMHYVPKSDKVLAASKVVIPNASEEFTFRTPSKEGVCQFVCTYPGHGYVMYGAMHVTTKPLPPLDKDKNVSPSALQQSQRDATPAAHQHVSEKPSPHPFALEYPLLYRTFMPNSGPASIAVALSPAHAYCFDAGRCMLRYVWTGGFVDNTDHWKGNGNALAKIQGQIYYTEEAHLYSQNAFYTKRYNSTKTTTAADTTNDGWGEPRRRVSSKFKGYSLQNRLPTFNYSVEGIEVSETISLLPNEAGIVRKFVFKKPLSQTMTFGGRTINVENITVKVNGKIAKAPDKFGIGLIKGTKEFSVTILKK